MGTRFWAYCGTAVVMLSILVPEGWAQDRTCLNQLLPCLNYLNGSSRGREDPPDSCCDPLKSVIKQKPECLCSMISIKGTNEAEQAGINVTKAQELPGRCGQHVNPIGCLRGAVPPNSKNSVPNSASYLFQCSTMIMMAFVTTSMIVQVLWELDRAHPTSSFCL
ncbi:unnamed protein product [Ilex paraguariensis]|uniref:Bifunctional inhibitor/plant lipid transfer protein/seed storage helical domain-containing protein n=1 Tax=Ilex paraguariensis TaxID=185542 RepID=A0ABC8TE54_9AQUA